MKSETQDNAAIGPNCQSRLVRPGDRLLIAITFPDELDGDEACHPDIVLEDFLASRNDGSWQVEVHSILPNVEMSCEATADTKTKENP